MCVPEGFNFLSISIWLKGGTLKYFLGKKRISPPPPIQALIIPFTILYYIPIHCFNLEMWNDAMLLRWGEIYQLFFSRVYPRGNYNSRKNEYLAL